MKTLIVSAFPGCGKTYLFRGFVLEKRNGFRIQCNKRGRCPAKDKGKKWSFKKDKFLVEKKMEEKFLSCILMQSERILFAAVE